MRKAVFIPVFALLLAGGAAAQERVDITSFENGDEYLWEFTGGMSVFSFPDVFDPEAGVEPQDGDWHLILDYDTSISQWGNMNLNFPDGTRDLTGMRELHFWSYFPEDAMPHQDGEYRFRATIGGGRELGTIGKSVEEAAGQWVEWVFPIDHLMYRNEDPSGPISELDGIQLRVNPGGQNVSGTVYIDNIFATRPADTPDELEYIQLWSFDEDSDGDLIPDGWQAAGQTPLIGDGLIEPSEGSNYMELALGGGWTQNGQGTGVTALTDRAADIYDVLFDLYLPSEFTGTWLNLQLIVQSGGEDADGNPLEPTNGWDAYGERGVGGWEKDVWHTMAFPVDIEKHMGAIENENGWLQFSFSTNQDGSQAGIPIFIDNYRIAVPAGGTDVPDWSVY